MTAMMLAIGYDGQDLRKALDSFAFSKIADYGPLGLAELPFNLERLDGVTHGNVLLEWIEDLLRRWRTGLRAGIGVVHQPEVSAGFPQPKGHPERAEHQRSAHVRGQRPAHHDPREDVDHEAE
jgi:hypothetical protein